MDVDEEYARRALECFRQHGFKECQKQFPKVTNSKTLTRYRLALQPGPNGYKFKIRQLKSYVQKEIQNGLPQDPEIIKQLVIQKSKELGIDSKLKCCEEFVRRTMKFNGITSGKVATERKSSKTALLLVAVGCHEMEVATITHVLKSASVDVTIVSIQGSNTVKCSHGMVIIPDECLKDVPRSKSFDAIVIPAHQASSPFIPAHQASSPFILSHEVSQILKEQESASRVIAVIGSSTLILRDHGIGIGRKVACDPNVADQLNPNQYTVVPDTVSTDGRLVTCQGTRSVTEFAIAIVRLLYGKRRSFELAKELSPSAPKYSDSVECGAKRVRKKN